MLLSPHALTSRSLIRYLWLDLELQELYTAHA